MFLILVVFVGIQFIPTKRNQSSEVLETDFIKHYKVQNNIQKLLKNSCYDCHSNNTIYPWYNKVQPVSWFLERDIKEGKAELNFSEFGAYSNRKKKSKLKSIASQIKDDKMPLSSYTLVHWNAKFSKNEKNEILQWIAKMNDSLK